MYLFATDVIERITRHARSQLKKKIHFKTSVKYNKQILLILFFHLQQWFLNFEHNKMDYFFVFVDLIRKRNFEKLQ